LAAEVRLSELLPETTVSSDPIPSVPDNPSEIERLVAEVLARIETDGEQAVSDVLAEHPQHANALQRHLSMLSGLGLMEAGASNADRLVDPSESPEELGDFRLLSRIGGGGMGVVYKAQQRSLGRVVALKLMRSDHRFFPAARERFRREVESVARLQHPAIVPVFATGEDHNVPWLAMELIHGASLDDVLLEVAGRDVARLRGVDLQLAIVAAMRRRGGDAEATLSDAFEGSWSMACIRIARTMAQALHHAHERGVLHRDVKPSNIMLTPDGRALLLDFGLARTVGAAQLTHSGTMVGTPAYMSPEQLRGELADVDVRTDVYALGVTLYELLTLRSPFVGPTAEATRQLVMAGKAPPLRAANATVSPDLEIVCHMARDLDVGRRYATAAALAQDLTNLLELRPIAAQAPSTFLIMRRWAQRRPATATIVVATFLLCFVAPLVFVVQQRAANEEIADALAVAQTERDRASAERDKVRNALAVALRDRKRARQAVETMLKRVANESLLDVPRMQHVRRELLASARTFYEEFLADSGLTLDLLADTVETTRMLAILDAELGNTETAEQEALHAVELARQLYADHARPEDGRLQLARTLMTLGSAQQAHGDLVNSAQSFREAMDIHRTELQQHPDDLEWLMRLLATHRSLSVIHAQLGHYETAHDAYQEMAGIWEKVLHLAAGTEHLADALEMTLGATCDESEFYLAHGALEDAIAALERCPAVTVEQLAELDDTARMSLCRLEVNRSKIASAQGKQELRRSHLRDALQVINPLLDSNPDFMPALRMKAMIHNDLAVALSMDGVSQAGTEELVKAIDQLRRLLALAPEIVEIRANLGASYINLGSAQQLAEDFEDALASFQAAKPLLATALAAVPSRADWQDYEYKRLWFVGQVLGSLGRHAEQVAIAHELAALRPLDGTTQRVAAGFLATSASLVAADEAISSAERAERSEELVRTCMAMLQQAADCGCLDFERVRDGFDFASVNQNPDFAKVLQQLSANQAAAKASAGK
jgi:serine/threonine protein kinase/tetratricopeptide (TPR) repeat protein